MQTEWRRGLGVWWPFAALCGLLLLRWNLAETYPQTLSSAASLAIGCGLAALLFAARAKFAKVPLPPVACFVRAGGAGAMLMAGPELASIFPGVPLAASSLIIALGLTPVVVAVAMGTGRSQAGVSARLLAPGIAAVAGLLLLLPEPNLHNAVADIFLLLAPLLTGLGCVLFSKEPAKSSGSTGFTSFAALAGITICFAIAAGYQVARGNFTLPSFWAVSEDAALATLSIAALSRISPAQYSARFALVPLLALLEGWVISGYR